jgi:uncharacterized membrane protein
MREVQVGGVKTETPLERAITVIVEANEDFNEGLVRERFELRMVLKSN